MLLTIDHGMTVYERSKNLDSLNISVGLCNAAHLLLLFGTFRFELYGAISLLA